MHFNDIVALKLENFSIPLEDSKGEEMKVGRGTKITTPAQKEEMLLLLEGGMTKKGISLLLGIGGSTVHYHIECAKLNRCTQEHIDEVNQAESI